MQNSSEMILPAGSLITIKDGIPEALPLEYEDSFRHFLRQRDHFAPIKIFSERREWTDKRGMYAFVSWRWVNPFVKWIAGKKVLEVMAGAGWLAKALRLKDVDVIATDSGRWQKSSKWPYQTDIEILSANRAIGKYGAKSDILILSWPYMDASAFHAIRAYQKIKPQGLVVYIGEEEGGCTADDLFFKHFQPVKDPTFEAVASLYQNWDCLHDRMYLGRYSHEGFE